MSASALISICRFSFIPVFLIAIFLFSLNIIGLFTDLRPSYFSEQDLVFENDIEYSYLEALERIDRNERESIDSYLGRLAVDLQKSVAHIEWIKIEDTSKYNQLVPMTENYLLNFMGVFSGIPEYEKYHFANYKRSLERGIGICGDMSMITSQVLSENGIESRIVSFPGHVFVEALSEDGSLGIVDSDFGVYIPYSLDFIMNDFSVIEKYYEEAGHDEETVAYLLSWLTSGSPAFFDDEKHFITKKYYFEYISYIFIWIIPIFLMLASIGAYVYVKKNTNSYS